jgi:hypothetical protein
MITGSSMDYGTRIVTIVYDLSEPSEHDIRLYCLQNYGFVPCEYTVDSPSNFKGWENPGIISCRKETV